MSRRLLITTAGGGVGTPPSGEEDTAVLVVSLRTLVNRSVSAGGIVQWDQADRDRDGSTSPSGAWSAGNPNRLTIQRTVTEPKVEVHLTTLGTDYSGASNADVQIYVVKNYPGSGAYLDYIVAGCRFSHATGANARLDELSQYLPGNLATNDVLQVLMGTAVLVEANPTTSPPAVPGNFVGLAGSGVIGCHFVLRGV